LGPEPPERGRHAGGSGGRAKSDLLRNRALSPWSGGQERTVGLDLAAGRNGRSGWAPPAHRRLATNPALAFAFAGAPAVAVPTPFLGARIPHGQGPKLGSRPSREGGHRALDPGWHDTPST
jgi:hypothetical protein